jgi:predicted MFS family arabinose efflux permease
VAIAVGTVTSSGLVALDPFPAINTLVIPLLAALVLRTLDLVSIWRLMIEPACPHARELISGLPTIVRDSVRLIRRSHILLALIAIELLWGAGMVAFETFTPLRLESVVGDPEDAAALLGPTNAVAWLASAGAAAAAPWLIRRAGAPLAGAAMRVAQGITVTGLALFSGPAGVLLAYLATMAMHGAANPVHQSLLHWAVTEPRHRATVLSANSLTGHLGWGIGAIGLGVLADAASLTIGILAGAALLAIAAPLYVVAREPPPPERATPQPSSRPAPPSRSRA